MRYAYAAKIGLPLADVCEGLGGTPCYPEEAARLAAYCELLDGVLRSAKAAKRVSITSRVDPESEK